MTRTVNDARNPKWANNAQTWVDLEVDFDELDEVYVPFTAMADDPEPHGVSLYNRAIAGDFGPIADFTPPPSITGDEAMEHMRAERNSMLSETDYIEMPTKWSTLTAEQQTAWSTYRNALRDMPANNPSGQKVWNVANEVYEWQNVTWPTRPE